MIKLHYIHENPFDALGFNVYLLLQEQPDSPFLILEDDEILGEIDFDKETLDTSVSSYFDEKFIKSVCSFIKAQQFLKLPEAIKARWPMWVAEVVAQSESDYLIVTLPDIAFCSFEKVFKEFLPQMLQDEWTSTFKVFNADFSLDFECFLAGNSSSGTCWH